MDNAIDIDYRVLLPGESPREYRKHAAALFAAIPPADYYEQLLVEEFAASSWVWRRARAVDTDYLHLAGSSYNRSTPGIAEALFHLPDGRFRAHRQFMHDAERRYLQARRAVEEIRRGRNRGIPGLPAAERELAPPPLIRVRAAARRAAVAEKRNEPNPPATAPSHPVSPLPVPPARNEPNPAPKAPSRPRVWQQVVVPIEPKPCPNSEREGDRAMRRFLEIAEDQLRNKDAA